MGRGTATRSSSTLGKVSAGTRAPAEKNEFIINVLNDDYTPAAHANVKVEVVGAEGEQIRLEAVEQSAGEYRAEFTPAKEGAYRIEAQADRGTMVTLFCRG